MARKTQMVVVNGIRYRPEDVPERAQDAPAAAPVEGTPEGDVTDDEAAAGDAEGGTDDDETKADDKPATKQRTPANKARTATNK